MAAGFVVLSRMNTTTPYHHLLLGLILLGTGMALSGSPATTSIVASLPREKQGVASSINDLSRELGGAIGIAVLGSVLTTVYRSEMAPHTSTLPANLAAKARGSLAAAQTIGHKLGAHDLVTHANTAFVHGVSLALLAGAAILTGGAAFLAFRAPGQAESQSNAGVKTAPKPSTLRAEAQHRSGPVSSC